MLSLNKLKTIFYQLKACLMMPISYYKHESFQMSNFLICSYKKNPFRLDRDQAIVFHANFSNHMAFQVILKIYLLNSHPSSQNDQYCFDTRHKAFLNCLKLKKVIFAMDINGKKHDSRVDAFHYPQDFTNIVDELPFLKKK